MHHDISLGCHSISDDINHMLMKEYLAKQNATDMFLIKSKDLFFPVKIGTLQELSLPSEG